jgi:hypothetical protein
MILKYQEINRLWKGNRASENRHSVTGYLAKIFTKHKLTPAGDHRTKHPGLADQKRAKLLLSIALIPIITLCEWLSEADKYRLKYNFNRKKLWLPTWFLPTLEKI